MDEFEEQAFPVQDMVAHGSYGMSLRDYFAAQALNALISKDALHTQIKLKDGIVVGASDETLNMVYKGMSVSAYAYADAMMEARKND